MKKVTIWHNPRCSKSRQGLAILEALSEEQTFEVEIVKYLVENPTLVEIKQALKGLEFEPLQMMRTKESLFKELDLKHASNEELIKAMAEHPKLIERPIVFYGTQVVMGRPPENINSLFESKASR